MKKLQCNLWAASLMVASVMGFSCVVISPAHALPLPPNTLWYNGDWDGNNGLANYRNTSGSTIRSNVYDDFNVPVADGSWTVGTIWSNNFFTTGALTTMADWFIRSGVSAGNGGAIVASGTSLATQTPTGNLFVGDLEYTVQVTGLNVNLSPGTYWLNVTPVFSVSGYESYNSTTSGKNAVGTPPGNNDNAFWDSAQFSSNFVNTTVAVDSTFHDFSMGVAGSTGAVPEPATLFLLGSGLAGLAAWRRRHS